ncbi:paraquat-inducible protein B [Haloferula luteola]|uniref:Paraquat-inducible protein B n=1 Tax=Haloferula luteola TaxID=595692 RepID=A0A840VAQ9_9BACT|nr:MlaD family protein [Haloferula luteola]MBB5349991.1 paraquat-inducible protein B [Haloferula luteola]
MTDVPPSPPTEEFRASVRPRRRISSVWVVPIVALALAGWLLWKNNVDRGPLVSVQFETAEGIASGKTELRCRSVPVGMVEVVSLTKQLKTQVQIRVKPAYSDLLRADSRFWVVRPRVSTSAVSGLGTLITGAYIELDPGTVKKHSDEFVGLEEPPVTSLTVPGLRLTLTAKEAGSLSVGSPIYYLGFEVGKVERRILDVETERVEFRVLIREKYADLVRKGTRFWNNSGFDVTAGSDGFKFRTPSVQALVTGGATFSTPSELKDSPAADDGDTFTLYDDQNSAEDAYYLADTRAILLFDTSIRGLQRGASIEFHGIPIGRVIDISFKLAEPGDTRIPVLIELESEVLRRTLEPDLTEGQDFDLRMAIQRGLHAKLASASIITGALYISLELDPTEIPETIETVQGLPVVPSTPGGLAEIQNRLNRILAKIEALPLDDTLAKFGHAADEATDTVAEARKTLATIEETVNEAKTLLASDSTQNLTAEINKTLAELQTSVNSLGPNGALQGDLRRALDEIRAAARSFDKLSNTVDQKPNSLLFGRETPGDPIPRARR